MPGIATDIQYIGYKGLRQVYLYSVQMYGGFVREFCRHIVQNLNFKGFLYIYVIMLKNYFFSLNSEY